MTRVSISNMNLSANGRFMLKWQDAKGFAASQRKSGVGNALISASLNRHMEGKNMQNITLAQLVQATKGTLLGEGYDPETVITGVESDNRVVKAGDVFLAFVGENTDGHRFVKAALEAGAAGAVVSQKPEELVPGKFYVLVADTILTLGELAHWYRQQFAIPVIGITGSVGKTTTKDMIASVLSEKYETLKTQGNFNNNIGLPKTLLNLSDATQIAVIEMGMNHLKEIEYLTKIAEPATVTITNVGDAHIGNLGSKENIFKAKSEIFEGLRKGGLAVLNGDDPYLLRLREDPDKRDAFRFAYVGEAEGCEWRAIDIQEDKEESMSFTAVTPIGTFPVVVPALGHHMVYPALTAAAMGAEYGLTAAEIQRGIAHYVPTKMRMETLRLENGVIIFNDTYNANPQSMKAGLSALMHSKAARHIAVLGDMKELGAAEETLHREVGAYAAGLGVDTLITVGDAAAFLAKEAKSQGLSDVRCCRSKEEAKAQIEALSGPDTAWLFKASRAMAFEELARYAAECGK